MIAFGTFSLWGVLITFDIKLLGITFTSSSSLIWKIFGFLFGGIIFLLGLFGLLYVLYVNILITIDKKSKSVVIKKNSNIKHFNHVREILFSEIEKIEIVENIFTYRTDWGINLNTIQGKSTLIYSAKSKSEAFIVAEKIRNLTNEEISYVTNDCSSIE